MGEVIERKLSTIRELRTAAVNEDWTLIDANIPFVCNAPDVLKWSLTKGINSHNGNVRDLAVSILEKSDLELDPEQSSMLEQLMQKDENPYVRFRSAFALYKRNDRSPAVISMMEKALEDKDVNEIAADYLRNDEHS